MSNVYSYCTVCNTALTKEELKKNEHEKNYDYSICDTCIGKAKNRVFDILEKTGNKKS